MAVQLSFFAFNNAFSETKSSIHIIGSMIYHSDKIKTNDLTCPTEFLFAFRHALKQLSSRIY